MNPFIQKYGEKITGTLSGWDRIVFRGTLRMLCFVDGMMGYLAHVGVLLKDFGEHAQAMTARLIAASLAAAEEAGRPIQYLPSAETRKEDLAREIAERDGIREGLICVLTCVEPCKSYEIHRNRHEKLLELKWRLRKCKFLYHDWIDPQFGFMSARIQTWFPFSIQVCMNGREWLARRMDEVGMEYHRYDNSFPWVEDFPKAQKRMDRMQAIRWPKVLDGVARRLNPAYGVMFRGLKMAYYWSAYQTEWATDLAVDAQGDCRPAPPGRSLSAVQPPLRRCPRFPGHHHPARHPGRRGLPPGHQGRQALPRLAPLVRRGSEASRSLERGNVCGSGILQS